MNSDTPTHAQIVISLVPLPPEKKKATTRYLKVQRTLASLTDQGVYSITLPGNQPGEIRESISVLQKNANYRIRGEPIIVTSPDDSAYDLPDEDLLNDLAEYLYAWLRTRESLRYTLAVWGLNQSEAARLFGVRRQALSKWLKKGIPSKRLDSVADLAAATDVLTHYLKRDRIPAVVRRPIPEKAGKSLLDLLGRGKTQEILETCRAMFDFRAVSY